MYLCCRATRTSWPSSATPQPNTTASMGGAVTKLGKSAHRLPTEDDCRVKDRALLLGVLLGGLLEGFESGSINASAAPLFDACTICSAGYDAGGWGLLMPTDAHRCSPVNGDRACDAPFGSCYSLHWTDVLLSSKCVWSICRKRAHSLQA